MTRKPGITDQMIIDLYQSGMLVKDIAIKTGLTPDGVGYVRKKHNLPARPVGQPRKHKVNEDFFKTWTHDMAWVLGVFITDGCVNGTLNQIIFIQKDKRILREIAKAMDAAENITKTYDTKTASTLLVNSKVIKNDLVQMGIHPNKSLDVPFPDVPDEFLPSFIRGVIDGDGYVYKDRYRLNVTSGSLEFSNSLHKAFESWGLKSNISIHIRESKSNFYRVWVKGKESVLQLAKIIYEDCDQNYVYRKRERMEQWNTAN